MARIVVWMLAFVFIGCCVIATHGKVARGRGYFKEFQEIFGNFQSSDRISDQDEQETTGGGDWLREELMSSVNVQSLPLTNGDPQPCGYPSLTARKFFWRSFYSSPERQIRIIQEGHDRKTRTSDEHVAVYSRENPLRGT